MPEGRRSSRALGRDDQSEALRLLEREAISDRLARTTPALQPYDNKDWKDPHCCFHAAIDGLTELRIFNNISMLELRTKVSNWLITAPEPETEGLIERWASQRQAASSHIGIFRTQRPSQTRKQWRDHCQSYGASQGTVRQGDDIVLFAIAHIYNCKVTVHKRVNSHNIAHPSTASKTLNIVLFDVQSDILSENWSHFCSTRPIELTERARLDEPRGVGLESTGHGLAHPTPAAGEDAPARAQGRATDAGLRNGGSGSNNGRSGSSSGSSNGRAGRAGDAGQLRAHGQAHASPPEERSSTPHATAAQRGRFTDLRSARTQISTCAVTHSSRSASRFAEIGRHRTNQITSIV
jgi:hypothetical protein